MARHIILAQSECTAAALCAWMELLGHDAPAKGDSSRIVFVNPTGVDESGVRAYEQLTKKIESAATMSDGSLALNDVVVLVDAIGPSEMNAAAEGGGWDHLIAMLILTFPEIKWVFGVVSGALVDFSQGAAFPLEEHSLASLVNRPRREPLLDPTGLREWVRAITNKELAKGKHGVELPRRLHCAAAIDEEKAFAYFHGYTAYRFGFRADTVTSWVLMREFFSNPDGQPHGYHLLIEDMSLKFPDKREDVKLVDFGPTGREGHRGRAGHCPKLGYEQPGLESSRQRILITTGQSGAGEKRLKDAKEYLMQKPNGHFCDLRKPVGGMWDLWQEAGLLDDLVARGIPGNAPGFKAIQAGSPAVEGGDHGAPGKLMLIAEVLMRRAEVFRGSACTVKDFIKGATLANDAMELLGGRTPSLTFSALAMKHEYEVRAECGFVGAGYHFDVIHRQQEIERDVKEISQWFESNKRRKAELDAFVVTLNRIAVVFRDAGQFDEEQQALVALRWAHRRLMVRTESPLKWPLHAGMAYAEWLLASFGNFVKAIAGWLIVFSGVWWTFEPEKGGLNALAGPIGTFLGGNPVTISTDPKDPNTLLVLFSCGLVAFGLFHIGVFISYIYSLISRR